MIHQWPTTSSIRLELWISRREEMTHLISLYICRFLCIYVYIYFFFQTCIFMYLSNICIYICINIYVYTQKSQKKVDDITRKTLTIIDKISLPAMDGILSQQLFPLESFLGGPRAKRYTWTYVYNPYKWPKNKWVCLELFSSPIHGVMGPYF